MENVEEELSKEEIEIEGIELKIREVQELLEK